MLLVFWFLASFFLASFVEWLGWFANINCEEKGHEVEVGDTSSLWGNLTRPAPRPCILIRWAHTQHVPLVCSAWVALPREIKDGWWGDGVLMGRWAEWVLQGRREGKGVGFRVWLWGKGQGRNRRRPLMCMCWGISSSSTPLAPLDTDLLGIPFILKTPGLNDDPWN